MKQVIIIFGPPGAGKGTQSELLAEKLGLYLFETSKFLEISFRSKERFVEFGGEKFDMSAEKKFWESGKLNSPPFVTKLVIEKIKELYEKGEDLIFAGSPRTIYEAERVTPVLEELFGKENIKIFLIEINAETTIFRNSHRKICELMRHSILFNKETENLTLCPLDGSKLAKRKDLDDPETIKVRIKEYNERTLPMVEYFNKNGIEVKKINGEQAVANVFNDILNSLK
ncbi:MAG: nucleoside monophosphate kinase [Candidatus Staskawiczbacteria bacterium]|nr:nucleoside monophosphate kinase [Candidatus Staskawiczbacteria bacterium]